MSRRGAVGRVLQPHHCRNVFPSVPQHPLHLAAVVAGSKHLCTQAEVAWTLLHALRLPYVQGAFGSRNQQGLGLSQVFPIRHTEAALSWNPAQATASWHSDNHKFTLEFFHTSFGLRSV
eukprot:1028085-Amphidinium_carterae.1